MSARSGMGRGVGLPLFLVALINTLTKATQRRIHHCKEVKSQGPELVTLHPVKKARNLKLYAQLPLSTLNKAMILCPGNGDTHSRQDFPQINIIP